MALANSQVFSSETLQEGIGALQQQRVKTEPDQEELQAELQDTKPKPYQSICFYGIPCSVWSHQDLLRRRDALAKASETTPGKILKKARLSDTGREDSEDQGETTTPKRALFQDWV